MNRAKSLQNKGDSTPDFVGAWRLLSREDRAVDGSPREEPSLGSDALGILNYANGRFAAQFMRRDRKNVVALDSSVAGLNNTIAVDGYDAFFGSYSVCATTDEVIHKLEGALTAENVGMEVSRKLIVKGNNLVI